MSVFRFGPVAINHQVESDSHESDERIYTEASNRQSCFANLLFGTPARLVGEHEALAPRLVMCPTVEYKRGRQKRIGQPLFAENVSKRRTAAVAGDDDDDDEMEELEEKEQEPVVVERRIIEIIDSQQPLSPVEPAEAPVASASATAPPPQPLPDADPCNVCGFLKPKSMLSCPACESFFLATNGVTSPAASERWTCGACTFENNMSMNVCETCGKVRSDEKRFMAELMQLRGMGFMDEIECTSLLVRYDGDVNRVLNDLLQ
jgi:hypothetical protein